MIKMPPPAATDSVREHLIFESRLRRSRTFLIGYFDQGSAKRGTLVSSRTNQAMSWPWISTVGSALGWARAQSSSNVNVSASRSTQQSRSVSLGSSPCRLMQCSREFASAPGPFAFTETGHRRTPITIRASAANMSRGARGRFGNSHRSTSASFCTRRRASLCGISESFRNCGQPEPANS